MALGTCSCGPMSRPWRGKSLDDADRSPRLELLVLVLLVVVLPGSSNEGSARRIEDGQSRYTRSLAST